MNQAILWLILLQPIIENRLENKTIKLKACGEKPAVTEEVKMCRDKYQPIKGYQQAILKPLSCTIKHTAPSVCA